MQLEQDDRGYFDDESKWACRDCLWEEQSECILESLFPDSTFHFLFCSLVFAA